MVLRPEIRRRILLRNLTISIFWFAIGLVSVAILARALEPFLVTFLAATSIALGTFFLTWAWERTRRQINLLTLGVTVEMTLGQDILYNEGRLKSLKGAVWVDARSILNFFTTGPIRIVGSRLVQEHIFELEWQAWFKAQVLHFYYTLEELEGLRSLYAQSVALHGEELFRVSSGEDIQRLSSELLPELEGLRKRLKRLDFYLESSLIGKYRRILPEMPEVEVGEDGDE